jgi:kinesin family protein 5
MRAKSIKNKARINAELSPSELKALLKKAQRDVGNYQVYVGLVEQELSTWRSGGTVDKAQWASMERALGLAPGEANALANRTDAMSPTPASGASTNGRGTPRAPALDSLKDLASRPQTPSQSGLDKDERDDFLKRENELIDQLTEKESALSNQERQLKELQEELATLRSQENAMANENKTMSSEVAELKLQLERLAYESKEAAISNEAAKEQNNDLNSELEELRKSLADMKIAQKAATSEDKEKKKAERLARLMGTFENEAMSEKEEQVRSTLFKLDQAVDSEAVLSTEDMSLLRKQLVESQSMAREESEKARRTTEDYDTMIRRNQELETRVASLEQECEELLDKGVNGDDDGEDVRVRADAMLPIK